MDIVCCFSLNTAKKASWILPDSAPKKRKMTLFGHETLTKCTPYWGAIYLQRDKLPPILGYMKAPNIPTPFMNEAQFVERVQDYARFHHMVMITDHALERMVQREITRRMVIKVLEKGTLSAGPKWNTDKSNWEGKLNGTVAGTRLSVVCAIREGAMTVTVVTAHKSAR